MTAPAPARRRLPLWIWIVLAVVVIVAIVTFLTLGHRGPKPLYGTCVQPNGQILANNITQSECVTRCPTCTWRQEN